MITLLYLHRIDFMLRHREVTVVSVWKADSCLIYYTLETKQVL
jgi:hypothetical protein